MTSNNHENTAILVVSCDAYKDLWDPFFHCFFKYWPDCPYPIFLGTNHIPYSDRRVQSLLIGEDLDYSSNLLSMLDQIEQEWIIFWIEDRLLSKPVDTLRLKSFLTKAIKQGAAYLKLINSHPFSFDNDIHEIGEVRKGQKYRVCMTVGLWNKKCLEDILVPGESAWDIERFGSYRSNNQHGKFLALSFKHRTHPPIHDTHVIIKGSLLRDSIGFLSQENLLDTLSKRPVQSLYSYIYTNLYLAFKEVSAYVLNIVSTKLTLGRRNGEAS